MSAHEFRELYEQLARSTPRGRRGALRHLTPERVVAAAAEVRLGRTVSPAAPIETVPGPDDPEPTVHRMTGPAPDDLRADGLHFATDRFAMNVHGDADSHLDALCHVVFDGTLYGGVPASSVTAEGARALSVALGTEGIVGRGMLLDIPRLCCVPWLEPGDHVTSDELTAAGRRRRSGRSCDGLAAPADAGRVDARHGGRRRRLRGRRQRRTARRKRHGR